jgi:hypothetical protein
VTLAWWGVPPVTLDAPQLIVLPQTALVSVGRVPLLPPPERTL